MPEPLVIIYVVDLTSMISGPLATMMLRDQGASAIKGEALGSGAHTRPAPTGAAALFASAQTGEGQHVRLSMLDAVVAFLWVSDMGSRTFVGDNLPQQEAASFIDLIYDTGDEPISVAVWSERERQAPAQAVGRPNWLDNPRYRTVADRQRNIDARLALMQEVPLARTARPRLAGAARHRRRVLRPCSNPQRDARRTAGPGQRHRDGTRPSARFSGTPAAVDAPAPDYGANAEAVLREVGVEAGRFAPTSPHGAPQLVVLAGRRFGPMAGQLSHFHNYALGEHIYSLDRNAAEYRRYLDILERRLAGRDQHPERLRDCRSGILALGADR